MAYKKRKENLSFIEALALFFSSIKRIWSFDKKYVVFTLFTLTLGTIPDIVVAFVNATFNQRIIQGCEYYAHYFQAYYPFFIAFFVSILDGVFFSIWRWLETKSKDKITSILLREAAEKSYKIDYSSYDDPDFYDSIQKGWLQDGELFVNSATNVITSISCALGMLAYISILAVIDWRLLIVIVILRLCFMPFEAKTYDIIYRLNNKLAETRRKEQYHRNFFGSKEGASEGKIYNLYTYASEKYLSSHIEIYKSIFINKIQINFINLCSNLMYNLPVVIGYIYLSLCVYKGTVSLADMTLFISMYTGFVNQLYSTVTQFSGFRLYAEKSRYAREFMNIPTNIYTDDDIAKETISIEKKGYSVEFRNVTFRYPNSDKNVLDNVSFYVEKNEMVSIIGSNGAGKSTMIQLMMRIYDPTEGVILLDGKDIRDYSVESLYKIYSVLFQDYCNYAVSAKESITFSTDIFYEDQFLRSLKASTAYKFIKTLKNGYDTSLSRAFDTCGTELSAGQKQRIALARAYYKDAPVIILDEPSASIDPQSEAEIFEIVNDMKGTRNIWLISHRLSTCVISDRILFFKNGILIGNGNHKELIMENDEYKRMFKLQSDRYEVL